MLARALSLLRNDKQDKTLIQVSFLKKTIGIFKEKILRKTILFH